MALARLTIRPLTVPPETLAHANRRKAELGASSHGVLLEALLALDARAPLPGLAEEVQRIEEGLREDRAARGRETIEKNRANRWPSKP
jgi:hypothetical protein